MIETKGLGAGSYPSPPEPKEKVFEVTVEGSFKGKIIVYTKDFCEASFKIQQKDYDEDEFSLLDYEIEDINDVKEIQ